MTSLTAPSTPGPTPLVARGLPATPLAGGKLLDLDTPVHTAAPLANFTPAAIAHHVTAEPLSEQQITQRDVDAAVAHANEQAQADAALLQLEIDDLRQKLGEERATNLEMTCVIY